MKFIVIAPPKNPKSAGSMVLYELADEIKNLGYEAKRVLIAQNKEGHFFISTDEKNFLPLAIDTLEQYFDPETDVIIHGENLHHKFFDKFNVARYYLNKIGALRNIGVPRDGEYKIAWQLSYAEKPDSLLRKPIIKKPNHEILQLDQPRWIDLTYIGKGSYYSSECRRLPGTLELTRSWPNDADEYLLLLSKTRFLFTFDAQTAVIEEAIVYGAQPVLMTCKPYENYTSLYSSLRQDVINCCMTERDFDKLDMANIHQHFHRFQRSRNNLIDVLDKHKSKYDRSLTMILEDMCQRFKYVA